MSNIKDISGCKFGKLTAIRPYGEKPRKWECICECGNIAYVQTNKLTSGHTRSCGCLLSSILIERNKDLATHKSTNTRLYRIYWSIKTRCNNQNHMYFHRYGGRGIRICKEWDESFDSFKQWALISGYDEKLSIDRIDNDGDYNPSNCRWATAKEQANNRSKKEDKNESI